VTVTGWAVATSTLAVQGTVALRLIVNRKPTTEITAEPTSPSTGYTSVATPQVGIAVANPYADRPLSAVAKVFDSGGSLVGQSAVSIPAVGHCSFNLSGLIPNLPANFTGSVRITPQTPGQMLLA